MDIFLAAMSAVTLVLVVTPAIAGPATCDVVKTGTYTLPSTHSLVIYREVSGPVDILDQHDAWYFVTNKDDGSLLGWLEKKYTTNCKGKNLNFD